MGTCVHGGNRSFASAFATPVTPILQDAKPAGTLHIRSANQALAYLRLDRREGLTAGAAKIILPPDIS